MIDMLGLCCVVCIPIILCYKGFIKEDDKAKDAFIVIVIIYLLQICLILLNFIFLK